MATLHLAKHIKGIGSCALVQQSDGSWFKVGSFSKSSSTEEVFPSRWRPSATRRCLEPSEIFACVLFQKVTGSSPLTDDTLWPWQLCNTTSSISHFHLLDLMSKVPPHKASVPPVFSSWSMNNGFPASVILLWQSRLPQPHGAIPAHQEETEEKDHCCRPKLKCFCSW